MIGEVRLMSKISIIAPVGTSPPVVTEFIQHVQESMFESVTDLTLIATREQVVLEGVELIKMAVKRRYSKVHIHVVELSFTDIASETDHLEFMKTCARILREQRDIYRADKVYLCVAGGRKDMCITLSLLAQYFGVNGVFHVIMPEVKAFSSELERMRYEINKLAEAENKDLYYQEKAERFDKLMYPPLKSYIVIRIPIIPIPQNIIYDVIKILKAKKVKRTDIDLPINFLKDLEASNIIRITSNFIYVEDVGYNVLKALGESI
jgi:CRISPR-associated protein Csx14